ncbi:hypothetical protein STCU_11884 [Strigomonas culicis]|uniref:Uncharacterized protein n=1 Tax=Strigomonas culicis TaxID=28005 RepID=S9UYN5_9TRYP|nr:hypothetical protein STCU_11884 [Strigomonas culicis]|eukprot:EPY15620.1 hypothetical protein STCU_11884 [Strigomonas culicis]
MLLAASATVLPQHQEKQQKAMVPLEGGRKSGGGPAAADVNLSVALQRSEATEGILCRSCNTYFTLSDFNKTLTKCPTCATDVLTSTLDAISDQYAEELRTSGKLIAVLRQGRGALVRLRQFAAATSHATDVAPEKQRVPPAAKRARPAAAVHASALSKDPFLVQQACVFLYFYNTKFAHIGDTTRSVIDVDDILTEREYERRMQGKSLIADAFRAVHRNPGALRCKLVTQDAVEQRKLMENVQKIEKRKQLPPWLQHTTTWSSLQRVAGTAEMLSAMEELPTTGGDGDVPQKHKTGSGETVVSKRPVKRSNIETSAATARLVAEDFLKNEFEEVFLGKRKQMQ